MLLIGVGADRYTNGLVQDLRDSGHISYAAGVIDKIQDSSPFDSVICHFSDCLFANYPNRDQWNHAVDDVLYGAIRHVEGNILRQMDRLEYEPSASWQTEPFLGTFDQRRRLLFDHLRYWNFALQYHQIDSVVFHNVPHQIFDTVIYHLCKAIGIRTLLFNVVGAFRDTNFVSESLDELGCLDFGIQLKSCGNQWQDHDKRIIQDWNRVCATVDAEDGAPANSGRPYSMIRSLVNDGQVSNSTVNFAMFQRAVFIRFRRFINCDSGSGLQLVRRLSRLRNVRRSREDERRVVSQLPLPKRFVYFPLHFQPEATTSAKGRHFVELYEVALSISNNLPDGVHLVIKEHPHQYQKLLPRPPGFMNKLAKIPKTFIVDSSWNSTDLRRKCLGVVTVSGTNGFELLASGKRVIAFGGAPWREAPGVHTVASQREVHEALIAVCNNGPLPRDLYLEFLTRLREGTVLAELSDSRAERTSAEDRQMEVATRVNIAELIRAWLH